MNGFRICGRNADRITSRGYGVRQGKCVILAWEEALYLAENEKFGLDFTDVFAKASRLDDFDVRFFVYRDLRARGYVVNIRGEYYDAKKSVHMPFYPMSDMDMFYFEKEIKKELPHIISVVDGDGDVTYYMVDEANPEGNCREKPVVDGFVVAGRRVFILNAKSLGTYGKTEGKFSYLSNMEARYLTGAEVVDNEEIYSVYEDLRIRGLVVKSGFKYGTHFRTYTESMKEHSRFLVHVLSDGEEIQKISRAVRVAHGVRKELLLSKKTNGKIKYLRISWIRP